MVSARNDANGSRVFLGHVVQSWRWCNRLGSQWTATRAVVVNANKTNMAFCDFSFGWLFVDPCRCDTSVALVCAGHDCFANYAAIKGI